MVNRFNPAEIKEGSEVYSLGEFDGQQAVYDFQKIVHYLNAKGNLLFGKKFHIWEENMEIVYRLSLYMIRDFEACGKYGIDPNKSILLTGPVGCGKTTLMKLIRFIIPHIKPYEILPTRNVTFRFNNLGYSVIEDYGNNGFYCFDDIGIEPIGRHFGKDCNVIGEVLLSRYELFLKNGTKTHATTNLNAEELEERYGKRIRSRMREMFNLFAFQKNSKDKRQ